MVQNRKGFTLIELLIVVVIIGILAAIAIPKFATTKNKAYEAAMKSDLKTLATAEESFFADSMHYGTATELGTARYTPTTNVGTPAITTGSGFWYATVTHSQLSGKVCGVAYGTTNPTISGAGEGEPACK